MSKRFSEVIRKRDKEPIIHDDNLINQLIYDTIKNYRGGKNDDLS